MERYIKAGLGVFFTNILIFLAMQNILEIIEPQEIRIAAMVSIGVQSLFVIAYFTKMLIKQKGTDKLFFLLGMHIASLATLNLLATYSETPNYETIKVSIAVITTLSTLVFGSFFISGSKLKPALNRNK